MIVRLAAYLAVSTALFAQTADEIASRALKAMGGAEEFAKLRSTRVTGSLQMSNGAVWPILVRSKRPFLFRMDLDTGGMKLTQAYDGNTAWQSMSGENTEPAHPLTGAEAAKVLDQAKNAIGGPLVDYPQRGTKLSLEPREDVNGKSAYKLKLVLSTGDIMYLYLDPDSYREMKEELTFNPGPDQMVIEETVSDYRPIGNTTMPFTFVSGIKGSAERNKLTLEKIEVNPVIDDAIFRMPASDNK